MKPTAHRSRAKSVLNPTAGDDRFIHWDAAIRGWLTSLDNDVDDANDLTAARLYLEALSEMHRLMAIQAAPRDQWQLFQSGFAVLAQSKKLGIDFSFEIDDVQGVFCIASSLPHSQHLPKMEDEFWKELLALHEVGQTTYSSTYGNSKTKSVLWAIIEEHMVLLGHRQSIAGATDPFLDSGQIRVSWPLRTPLASVLRKGTGAFRQLYRLSYLLHRHEYVLQASRTKNQRTSSRKIQTDS